MGGNGRSVKPLTGAARRGPGRGRCAVGAAYPVAERLRSLIDRLSPADRTRLLSIASVLDQIVQLASEQYEKPDERSGK
jgi:hypothetical protein